jgi:hypothetical protein
MEGGVEVHVRAPYIPVAQQGAPGSPRNGGRMDYDEAVVADNLHRGEVSAIVRKGGERSELPFIRLEVAIVLNGWKTVSYALDELLVFLIGEYDFRRAIIQIKLDLIGGKPPIYRKHDCADRCRCAVEQKIFQAVFAQDPDPIPFLDARMEQAACQSIDLFFILSEGQSPSVVNLQPCAAVLETTGIAVNKLVQRKIVQSHVQSPPFFESAGRLDCQCISTENYRYEINMPPDFHSK